MSETCETIEQCVARLVREYAESMPAEPGNLSLSLRKDFAIESLSLVSLALRLGEEFGVDVAEMGLEIGQVATLGDLVKMGQTISEMKQT